MTNPSFAADANSSNLLSCSQADIACEMVQTIYLRWRLPSGFLVIV